MLVEILGTMGVANFCEHESCGEHDSGRGFRLGFKRSKFQKVKTPKQLHRGWDPVPAKTTVKNHGPPGSALRCCFGAELLCWQSAASRAKKCHPGALLPRRGGSSGANVLGPTKLRGIGGDGKPWETYTDRHFQVQNLAWHALTCEMKLKHLRFDIAKATTGIDWHSGCL